MSVLAIADQRWRIIGFALLVAIVATPNVYLVARSISIVLSGSPVVDWHHFVEAGLRVHAGGLYEIAFDYGFRYSPVLAIVFGFIAPIGELAWRILHVGAALALPNWPMRLITLASWPFWFDVEAGNVLVFVLLAAAWALRGNRVAIGAFFVMAVLMPRPLILPILAWLLWRHPGLRVPFVSIVVLHTLAVWTTGWGAEWVSVLLNSTDEVESPLNLGPSRFVGLTGALVALPVAAWLTWRGRLGWASLLAAPYWLPYYLLMPVLEVDRRRWTRPTT